MDLIKFAISKPVTVAVGVILVILFGVIGLTRLPVQLAPDTELPKVQVYTLWSGASPSEVESEIVEKQEDKLKGLQDLHEMSSSSYNSLGQITLTFNLGTDIDTAVQRVSNKLDEVWDAPADALKPIIRASGAEGTPIVFLSLKTLKDNPTPVTHYQTYFQNEAQQYLERIDGVAYVMSFGGLARQLEIVLDPIRMARHNITINQVLAKMAAANNDISAGLLDIDRKNYRIRTAAKFQTVDDPMDVVIYETGTERIFLRDIGFSRLGYESQFISTRAGADECISIFIQKQSGANVLDVTARVRAEVDRLNREVLADEGLYIEWMHDDTPYILQAMGIVRNNFIIGAVLAVLVLLVFLRSLRSTLITGFSIPVSAVGTFVFLWLLDRNLNVVSLAGISFAVGMLVDNSIVVLENIDRHRAMGKKIASAAYEGAKEVYGAVIASTLTTVAVFLPVIFMRQEAGQLFKDIAIAVTAAILISLLVSVAMIPTAMNLFYRKDRQAKQNSRSAVDRLGGTIAGWIASVSDLCLKTISTRLLTICGLTAAAVSAAWILMPKAEYLPQGNRNFLMGILIPPASVSGDQRKAMGDHIYEQLRPYMEEDGKDGYPQIDHFFYVNSDMFSLCGANTIKAHETEVTRLMPLFNQAINSMPDLMGVAIQPGIFDSEIGQGRTVELNISGEDLDAIINAAGMLFMSIPSVLPNSQIRPVPSLEKTYPEANIVPEKSKMAASGLTETDLGNYIAVMTEGKKIGEFRPDGGYQIDLVVRTDEKDYRTPEDLLNGTIADNYGQLIRVGDVARVEYVSGMTQIAHLEKKRNVRLEITPPETVPLQSAMEKIEALVQEKKAAGLLDGLSVQQGGNADKLTTTMQALSGGFILALIITYLLMSALFENFLYPLTIMFSIPLAAAGGFIGLDLVNRLVAPQPMDVLTMLGFIMLVGTVVNNAILIVHQSLNNVRYNGLIGIEAIRDSVRTRIRPIFMSALTTLFGLTPLVLSTGSGSEMYRGIGSVMLGGLALSTLFTLLLIPSLLAFFIGWEKPRRTDPA